MKRKKYFTTLYIILILGLIVPALLTSCDESDADEIPEPEEGINIGSLDDLIALADNSDYEIVEIHFASFDRENVLEFHDIRKEDDGSVRLSFGFLGFRWGYFGTNSEWADANIFIEIDGEAPDNPDIQTNVNISVPFATTPALIQLNETLVLTIRVQKNT